LTARVVAIEMGYGHLRAAVPLGELLGTEVLHADRPPLADPEEQRLWAITRRWYERLCRSAEVPVVGAPLGALLGALTFIPPLHPRRDLSAPTLGVRAIEELSERGLGQGMCRELRASGAPLVTTFFAPALLADRAGLPRIHCVVTDSDINRIWAPRDAGRTRIRYYVPSRRAARRLAAYGVPADCITLTGFPLPHERLGGPELPVLRRDLAARLLRLDPERALRRQLGDEIERFVDGVVRDDRPPLVTFAVGGAGVQAALAQRFLPGMRAALDERRLRLCLVAGVRREVADAFGRALDEAGLGPRLGDGVEILVEPDFDAYFRRFHALLGETDVLWTKPSEMTFFAALGLPLVLAPPVGVHEEYNRRWAMEAGAAVDQRDPRWAGEWLTDWIADGTLAGAAWAGFRRLPKRGLYRIVEAVSAC
jgi:hypothetical protein